MGIVDMKSFLPKFLWVVQGNFVLDFTDAEYPHHKRQFPSVALTYHS